MRISMRYPPAVFESIGAAESVKIKGLQIDDTFVARLWYLKSRGCSFRLIGLITGYTGRAVAYWSRGLCLPRDAHTRMLIYQMSARVQERDDQGPTASIN